ncbi:hypothetical protein V1477_004198, partial [Vespula maculifrons]
ETLSKEDDTFIVTHHKIRDIFFLRFLNRRSSVPSSTAAKSFRLIIAISFSSKVSTGRSIPDIDNIYLKVRNHRRCDKIGNFLLFPSTGIEGFDWPMLWRWAYISRPEETMS